ncbi:hypothetical protein NM688_g3040 [Phlebia brevispora]|uniref:Uncharacterized protein n=1 Tax=Phlebia brevispora TaxID=194682 RepID=A0ACC1T6Z0_9APHY|nr:hypothetical protein NM688_g3040 [Phlebia brevispora]
MFKKPLSTLKTSAPLRSSYRRKFKQRVVNDYGLSPEDGDLLVPEGLLSQKFSTYANEPGVVYLSPEGDPLWFSIGKGSDGLIPTVYTLWKRPNLLPFLSTPAAVVPKLIDGADLMIPGVVQYSATLTPEQLVSITRYHRDKLGPPLAVGTMAVSGETLRRADEEDTKGKAVYVPEARDIPPPQTSTKGEQSAAQGDDADAAEAQSADIAQPAEPVSTIEAAPISSRDDTAEGNAGMETLTHEHPEQAEPSLPPEDVSVCLRNALLQAISTTLGALPSSSYPMPASVFWSNYVLPARPAQVIGAEGPVDANAIDIKRSTYKTVKAFLKVCAKEGIVKIKESKGDVVVTGVSLKHPAVAGHQPHRTIQSVDAQREKAEERQRKAKEAEEKRKTQIQITELWRPHGHTLGWFVAAGVDTSNLYSIAQIRELFIKYVSSKNLINVNDQSYINVKDDEPLAYAISTRNQDTPEFLKRDDLLNRIRANMQEWYEMRTESGETIRKKGQVKPISIEAKVRQGRKTSTFITGFEHFGIDATELAEELRKACAGATSVSPQQGKPNELEVMVQGIHIKTVTDLLVSKGVPAKWIKASGLKEKKK